MKNRNTGFLLIILGMVFYVMTKVFTLSTVMWGIFLVINIVLNITGVLVLIYYIRNERKTTDS